MTVKLNCPNCRSGLQVPTKLLGQYTQCPACRNRILIPPQPPGDPGSSASGSFVTLAQPSGGSAAPPANRPPAVAPVPPPTHAGHNMPAAAWRDHPVVQPPPPERKVARFITAESAPATVHLTAGGELPKLQLTEGAKKKDAKRSGLNPLVVVGAACLSFCMSAALLLVDFDTPAADSQQEARIRQQLESYYKDQRGPLQPYQVQLRDAEQARSRGDRRTEQRHYRKVLEMLHSEGRSRFRGLTGTPLSDENLEKLLARLLAGQSAESAPEE